MQGPALMTVTGVTEPSSRNNCVIPSFLPIIPLTIFQPSVVSSPESVVRSAEPRTNDYGLRANLFVVLAEGFNFDVNSRRKIELHQRIYRLRGRIEYVHQPLVRSNLELLARLLVHVRTAQRGFFVLPGGRGNGPRHSSARSLRRIYYLGSRLVEHAVVISLQPDSYFFVQHFTSWSDKLKFVDSLPMPCSRSLSRELTDKLKFVGLSVYSIISATVPAPTVRPPSRIANLSPFSIAIGAINSISNPELSPGITISTPSFNVATPVTSVVRK